MKHITITGQNKKNGINKIIARFACMDEVGYEITSRILSEFKNMEVKGYEKFKITSDFEQETEKKKKKSSRRDSSPDSEAGQDIFQEGI